MTIKNAYPLDWPAGWPVTSSEDRKRARYTVSFDRAQMDLIKELVRLDRSNHDMAIISADIPVRRDGMHYASYKKPDNPGVSVFFYRDGKPHVIACDTWDLVKDNMRAVGLTIEALRALERTGASGILDRAYSGFEQLPYWSNSWVNTLEMQDMEITPENVKKQFRTLAQKYHPDKPLGDPEKFKEICQARKDAEHDLNK